MRTIEELTDAIDAVVATDPRLSFQLTMEELNAILDATAGNSDIEITTLQQGSAAANEIQSIRLNATFSGGTFTLTFSGQTTAGIAPTANAADVKAALESLSNIAADDLTVTGTLNGGMSIEFGGTLANTNVSQLTIDVSGLTGPNIHADASTTTEGVLGVSITTLQNGMIGPVAHWSLDETTGTRVDMIGTNDLLLAASDVDEAAGLIGNALDAGSTGGANWLTCDTNSDISLGDQDWSISFWVHTPSSNLIQKTDEYRINFNVGGSLWGITAFLTATPSQVTVNIGSLPIASHTEWHHFALVHNAATNTLSLYMDAVLGDENNYSGTFATSANALEVGRGSGLLDELVIYHEALTQTHIDSLYNAGAGTADVGPQNEQQQVTLGNSNGGTFTLTFDGQTTAAIAYDASNAAVDAALEALSNIGAGDISITGGPLPGTPIVVEFVNAMAAANQPQMTGPAPVNEVQVLTMTGTPTLGAVTITFDGESTVFAYNESAASAQTKLRLITSIDGANVNVTGGPWPGTPLTITFVGTLAGTNVPEMTTDNTMMFFTINTTTQGNPATNERQQIEIVGVQAGTFTLTFSGQTTGSLAYDASNATVDAALEALSNIGAGDITITGGPLPGTAIVVEFVNAMAAVNQSLMTATESWETLHTKFDDLDLPDGALLRVKALDLQQILLRV
jgi:hypothetical protein